MSLANYDFLLRSPSDRTLWLGTDDDAGPSDRLANASARLALAASMLVEGSRAIPAIRAIRASAEERRNWRHSGATVSQEPLCPLAEANPS